MGSLEVAVSELLESGELTLSELGREITARHERIHQLAGQCLQEIVRNGERLIQAHQMCRDQRIVWYDWLDEQGLERSTVNLYTRAAHLRDLLEASPEPITSLRAVRRALHHVPSVNPGPFSAPAALVERAKELRAEGITQRAIADALGVSQGAVCEWLDPAVRARKRERAAARMRQKRRAERALAEQERGQAIRRAVHKEGGALAEAYALLSKLDQVLGQARQEATTRERRTDINEMHAFRDKMMDVCVRTLGVS